MISSHAWYMVCAICYVYIHTDIDIIMKIVLLYIQSPRREDILVMQGLISGKDEWVERKNEYRDELKSWLVM